jgi:pyruvate/2-oxoglutarate dehydrogenase complex dihydrolipoamide dehydrogenase (E3) component
MTTEADIAVVGAGPAGVFAALRAADLGARTVLISDGALGGMAANDGPVPVRTLAQAARLMRDARRLGRYGVAVGEARLNYPQLLARVAEVVGEVQTSSALRTELGTAGVDLKERAGVARFIDAHLLETPFAGQVRAEKIILCVGGVGRRLPIPGFDLVASHSDAWSLASVPASMLVIGAGATGAQVASIFNAFGAKVALYETGERILRTEEPEVSVAVAAGFRTNGIEVCEGFGHIEAFEKTPDGIRMVYIRNGVRLGAEASLAVAAVGWRAATDGLDLAAVGIETDERGFVRVDASQRTSAAHIWAAGDVTGGLTLAPQAMQAGFAAATNAVTGSRTIPREVVSPIGSFTDPEYAQVGLGEAAARQRHDIEVAMVGFETTTRPIIDGCTAGFCKLIADRASGRMLGCHVVGDRAVDIAQIAAVAMAGGLRVDDFARIPLSFPTYSGVLARAAAIVARRINHTAAATEAPAPAELR